MAKTRSRRRGTSDKQSRFATIPEARIPRSAFNRSFNIKTTFDEGYLIPVFVDEALPGDTMAVNTASFCRMATPLKYPMMDSLHLDLFFFSIPNRLVWENWQRFMGEKDNPDDTTTYLIPQVTTTTGWDEETLYDYLGFPINTQRPASALFPRAYGLVWNEWFRDQNLQDSTVLSFDDGPDLEIEHQLKKRGKRHDYFTSSLPFPQKGDSVNLPLGTDAPLVGKATVLGSSANGPQYKWSGSTDETKFEFGGEDQPAVQADNLTGNEGGEQLLWGNPYLYADLADTWSGTAPHADLTSATAATINEIRQAFQMQKLLERDARGGTRYVEILRTHFGVTSADARHMRPEYLGGGHTQIMVNPVAQTSETTAESPIGELAAYATGSSVGRGFNKSFTEHCIVLGLVCVRADLNYQEGMPRMFERREREEFYFPAFAHLGEQTVLNAEIYVDDSSEDDEAWGYQERWAEYRYKPSVITGAFRSTHSTPLDAWHLAQHFDTTRPALNDTFIQEAPPVDRIVAVTDEPHFLLDMFFQFKHVRPMPTYSVPGLIDHF